MYISNLKRLMLCFGEILILFPFFSFSLFPFFILCIPPPSLSLSLFVILHSLSVYFSYFFPTFPIYFCFSCFPLLPLLLTPSRLFLLYIPISIFIFSPPPFPPTTLFLFSSSAFPPSCLPLSFFSSISTFLSLILPPSGSRA